MISNTSSLGLSVSSSNTVVVLLSLAVAAEAGGDMAGLRAALGPGAPQTRKKNPDLPNRAPKQASGGQEYTLLV